MKNIYQGLLLFVMIILLSVIGGTAFGALGAILGFIAGLAIVIIAKRPTVYFMLGQREYAADRHDKAYAWMKKAYDTTKLAPRYSLTYAYMLIRDGNITEGENLINKITYLNKRDLTNEDLLNANINKALVFWKKGDLTEGIKLLEEMYDKGLKSTTLYGTLGYFYILNNELSKAMEFNKEGYEYNSDNMIIEDNLGSCCILNSEFEKAEEIYQKIFTQNPQFIEPFYNYGILLEKKGMFKEAKEYYQKALKYPEKFLSTITHRDIRSAIENLGVFQSEKATEAEEVSVKETAPQEMPAQESEENV